MAEKTGASMNWGGLDKKLGNAAKALTGKRKELLANVGAAMVSSTVQRFVDGVDPDGTAWEKSGRGGKTLVDTALLQNSISAAVTFDSVLWGSNLEYARIHQKGGTIKPKKGKYLKFKGRDGNDVFVKEVTMPKRAYLGVNDDDKEEMAAIVGDFLNNAFGS